MEVDPHGQHTQCLCICVGLVSLCCEVADTKTSQSFSSLPQQHHHHGDHDASSHVFRHTPRTESRHIIHPAMSSPPRNDAGGWGASSNYAPASLASPPPPAPPEPYPAAPGAPPPTMQSRYGGAGGGARERHRPKYKERELEESFKDSCRIHLPSKRGMLGCGGGRKGGEERERRGGEDGKRWKNEPHHFWTRQRRLI